MDKYVEALRRVANAAKRFMDAHIASGKASDAAVRKELRDLAHEIDELVRVENELDQPESN